MAIPEINGHQFTYEQFLGEVRLLVAAGKTTGHKQTPELAGYTSLNLRRMERLHKTLKLQPALIECMGLIERPQRWIVITEAWCGDSAQCLPVIGHLAAVAPAKVDLRVILRDENPHWMELYHTNGSKSIPKLVAFDSAGQEVFRWGPRPAEAQQLLMAWKADPDAKSFEEFERELHTWYTRDKTRATQRELLKEISSSMQNRH